jgi:hypothetical protein
MQANLFDLDLRKDLKWQEKGPLLVIGNPPWVTNAEIGGLNGGNLPSKTNLRGLNGINAMTGESNFDLAESIWIKLITELAHERPTIALLCKTSVARNVLRFAHEKSLALEEASIRKIPAGMWFGASVDACLFKVRVGSKLNTIEAKVYADLAARKPETVWGVRAGGVVDLTQYERSAFLDGACSFSWRQGVKHDAATVMELTESDGVLVNRMGHEARVEPEYVYPLLKGADLFGQEHPAAMKFVLVTQRRVGEDTEALKEHAPKLWQYLQQNAAVFVKRKSSVFRNAPRFAMFGIGDYSFARYKVAVAALYKVSRFRVVGPFYQAPKTTPAWPFERENPSVSTVMAPSQSFLRKQESRIWAPDQARGEGFSPVNREKPLVAGINGRPVMFDDTCYFVACGSLAQAALVACLLNHPLCLDFIAAVGFPDAKRRVTKKLLSRIDLTALFRRVDGEAFRANVRKDIEKFSAPRYEDFDAGGMEFHELLQPSRGSHNMRQE